MTLLWRWLPRVWMIIRADGCWMDFPGLYVEDVLQLGDRVFLFYSINDKKSGMVGLMAREIDMETGRMMEKTKDVAMISDVDSWEHNERGFNENQTRKSFSLKVSENGKLLMVMYQIKKTKKSSKITNYGAMCFTVDLIKKWETTSVQEIH